MMREKGVEVRKPNYMGIALVGSRGLWLLPACSVPRAAERERRI